MKDNRCPDCPGDLNCDPRERKKRYELMTLDRFMHEKTVQALERSKKQIYRIYGIVIALAILLWINGETKAAVNVGVPGIVIFTGSLMLIPIVQYTLRVKPPYLPPPCSTILNLNSHWAWLHKRIKLVQRMELISSFTWISFFIWFLFTLETGKVAIQLAGMIFSNAIITWATIYEYKLKNN